MLGLYSNFLLKKSGFFKNSGFFQQKICNVSEIIGFQEILGRKADFLIGKFVYTPKPAHE